MWVLTARCLHDHGVLFVYWFGVSCLNDGCSAINL